MSESLQTAAAINRLANGYREEIAQLEREELSSTDPDRLRAISFMLAAKRWHLERHLADLAEATH